MGSIFSLNFSFDNSQYHAPPILTIAILGAIILTTLCCLYHRVGAPRRPRRDWVPPPTLLVVFFLLTALLTLIAAAEAVKLSPRFRSHSGRPSPFRTIKHSKFLRSTSYIVGSAAALVGLEHLASSFQGDDGPLYLVLLGLGLVLIALLGYFANNSRKRRRLQQNVSATAAGAAVRRTVDSASY